jgi:GlpG protein
MRIIGHLPSAKSATTFSDFLYVQGIANEVEPDKNGWAVWIHSEDDLERAREFLARFVSNPAAPEFHKEARQAGELRERAAREDQAAGKRVVSRKAVFRSTLPYGVGPLTFGLMFACVALWAYAEFGPGADFEDALHITEYSVEGHYLRWKAGLPEVRAGQLWRLVTPALLHGGIVHLFFNMLWLLDLGSMIEGRRGTGRLALLFVVIAAGSNLAQYLASGPNFRGLSGVVYGLLGYVWMKGKFDPGADLALHPQTVTMMLIWFFVCLTGWVGPIANTAHAAGLGMGVAWGFLASLGARRSR